MLLSGPEALPDDDLESSSRPRPAALVSGKTRRMPRSVQLEAPPIYTIAGLSRAFNSEQTLATATAKGRAKALQRAVLPVRIQEPHPARTAHQAFARVGVPVERVLPRPPVKCRDVRKEVVIESGFEGHADVFSKGRAALQWTRVSLSSASPNFVVPATEQVGVFVVHTGKAALLKMPMVAVSDASVLSVEFSETQSVSGTSTADGNSLVFLSRHFCKSAGIATISIELPLQKNMAAHSPEPLCSAQPAPIVFSYQKACSPPAASPTEGTFLTAPAVHPRAQEKMAVLARRSTSQEPWSGIPSGGFRAILIVGLSLMFIVVTYELGAIWLSRKLKQSIIKSSPQMFGVQANMSHTAVSFWGGHLTYTMHGFQIQNPDEGEWSSPYLLSVDEVKLWFNLRKLLRTCGGEIEIALLHARHVKANVEVDGYLFGKSNITAVTETLDRRNKQWHADLAAIKEKHGVDVHQIFRGIEERIQNIMKRVTLKEVEIENIGYSFSNKSLGTEMKIADMEFHDFSVQHNAVGMNEIGYSLTHSVLEGMSEDIAGVQFGHGRFEGIVNTLKSFTQSQPPTA